MDKKPQITPIAQRSRRLEINKDKLLYLVTLRSYSAEIDSFVLVMAHLRGGQDAWFDVAFMCTEEKVDVRGYEDVLRCSVYCLKTPSEDDGLYGKLSAATELISNYAYVCLCSADDIWSIPKQVWARSEEWNGKVIPFRFLCAQPVDSRRLLVWNGFQQLQFAGQVVEARDRLKRFASEGPVTVYAIYDSIYLMDLIKAIQAARRELVSIQAAFENLIEDFINISNLAVGFEIIDGVWSLRFMNSNYAERDGWMISVEIVRRLGPVQLEKVSEVFFSNVQHHIENLDEASIKDMHKEVTRHAVGYSCANSRFYREGFDVLLCTSEDVQPHNVSAGRKFWPVRVLRSGLIEIEDLPVMSRLREPEVLSLLNLPDSYWGSLSFKEWAQT